MPKAVWNGVVLAESDQTILIEGNHYFPPHSIHRKFFKKSSTQSLCPWKGVASYYNIEVEGKTIEDAAWFYPDPKPMAEKLGLKNQVGFWRGVEIEG